jgi:hypothetical protein
MNKGTGCGSDIYPDIPLQQNDLPLIRMLGIEARSYETDEAKEKLTGST